jgi:hypothetical protein
MSTLFESYKEYLTEISASTAAAYPEDSQAQHSHNVWRLMQHYSNKLNHHHDQVERHVSKEFYRNNPDGDRYDHDDHLHRRMNQIYDQFNNNPDKLDPKIRAHMEKIYIASANHTRVADTHFAEMKKGATPERMKEVAGELKHVTGETETDPKHYAIRLRRKDS